MLKLWLLETLTVLPLLIKETSLFWFIPLKLRSQIVLPSHLMAVWFIYFWCFPFRASTVCCKASRPGSCPGENGDFPVWSNWKPSASHLLEERREPGETAFLSSFLAVSSRNDFTWEKSIVIIVLKVWETGLELGDAGYLFFTSKTCAC